MPRRLCVHFAEEQKVKNVLVVVGAGEEGFGVVADSQPRV